MRAADGHARHRPFTGAQFESIASIHAVFLAISFVALSLDKETRPVGCIGAKFAMGQLKLACSSALVFVSVFVASDQPVQLLAAAHGNNVAQS